MNSPCPCCGYCPTCGRRNLQPAPYYPQPIWISGPYTGGFPGTGIGTITGGNTIGFANQGNLAMMGQVSN